MSRNFQVVDGIYLVLEGLELYLHNNFNFGNLDYSVKERKLALNWLRSNRNRVSSDIPKTLRVEFSGVSEFRFVPRDSETPLTEDDCINCFGYRVDAGWTDEVIMLEPKQKAESNWLTALDFMSGAVLAVRAERDNAKVIA